MKGSLDLAVDAENRFIRVIGSGFWTEDQVRAHFIALGNAMTTMRATHGRALVLIDLRKSAVQSQDTVKIISEKTGRIYLATDRGAIVVASGLLRIQIRKNAPVGRTRTFDDMDAAIGWLLETPA